MARMMNSILLGFFLSLPVLSADAQKLLEQSCLIWGAFRPEPGEKYEYIIHAQNSRLEIKEFLGDSSGIIVVLGPGTGMDLPMIDFALQGKKLILIDGYIEPMVAWKKTLVPGLRGHIEIIQMDLSGGFSAFLCDNKPAIISALHSDLKLFLRNQKTDLVAYKKLLRKQKFVVDIAQYNPDILISSLITSQTVGVFTSKVGTLLDEVLIMAKLSLSSEEKRLFIEKVEKTNESIGHPTYMRGILNCGAKKIYYADTNKIENSTANVSEDSICFDELVSSRLLKEFTAAMAKRYRIKSVDDAWDYREQAAEYEVEWRAEETPVSWIKFFKKDDEEF
jgi:hypothetical protein